MRRFLIFILALFSFLTVISAQEGKSDLKFKEHAFLQFGGGIQYTLGEADFDKLLSPNCQLGIGYKYSPLFGMRLQVNAWQSKGGWNGYTTNAYDKPFTANYKFKYIAPGVDFMFDISNFLVGYNPKRFLDLTSFVGTGVNIGWNNDEANDIATNLKNNLGAYRLEYLWQGEKIRPFARGGVILGVRLTDAVSLFVEGSANVLSDRYNSKKADNADWYFNALAGLHINLGKTYSKRNKPVPVEFPQPIAEKPAEPAIKRKVNPLRQDVFFTINSFKVSGLEEAKVKKIADFLKENTRAKVLITGYADAGTGNNRVNDAIALKRANMVAEELIEIYNIQSDRISIDSKGARVQPYAENDKNRVSVCLAE